MIGSQALFTEDDLLPISALQHLLFCERQCALIHIEGLWVENRLTMQGRHLHQAADHGRDEARGRVRTVRALPLHSLRLGIVGRADVVEFHEDSGCRRSVPVEYKRGRPKPDDSDRVQLCAQALCLEEMLGTVVAEGILYYASTRRRTSVHFDGALRGVTERSVARLHELIASGRSPRSAREPKCENCSLLDLCLPDAVAPARSAKAYFERAVRQSLGDDFDNFRRPSGRTS